MDEAKRNYYEAKKETDDSFGGLSDEITNYVDKLEKRNEGFRDVVKEVYRYVDELEKRNKAFERLIIELYKNDIGTEYDWVNKRVFELMGEIE